MVIAGGEKAIFVVCVQEGKLCSIEALRLGRYCTSDRQGTAATCTLVSAVQWVVPLLEASVAVLVIHSESWDSTCLMI